MPSAKKTSESVETVSTDILDEPVPAETPAEPESASEPAEEPHAEEVEATAVSHSPSRMETFTVTRPDGKRMQVTRNIDTGEQSVSEI
jgi:hypothetical protein